MGAIASGGIRILNEEAVRMMGITDDQIAAVAAEEEREMARRERHYRGGCTAPGIRGRTVVLVDDGLATGSTMRAAAAAVWALDPARLVIGAPVGAPETCEALREEGLEVVCPLSPTPFQAVGLWYDDFAQTIDDEVRGLLLAAAGEEGPDSPLSGG